MLAFYVLLSVILTNSICLTVSAQLTIQIENHNLLRVLRSHQRSASIPRAGSNILGDKSNAHSIRKRANSVTNSSYRSERTPLVEVMLRILNTIQLVPKKRSRRSDRPVMKKSLSPSSQPILSPVMQNSLDPYKAPVFFNAGSQPLMISSLEQTLDDASEEQHSIQDSLSVETVEIGSNESDVPDINGTDEEDTQAAEESDEKLYDLLLKILKVLDDQAYREAERNRRLDQLRSEV